MSHATLSIVVPAFNEEDSIARVIDRLMKTREELLQRGSVSEVDILVVDDGSTDRTTALVRSYPSVRLIQHEVNRGYGAALKTGFRHATGTYLAFLDADASYHPESIPDLLTRLIDEQADVVVGSRMMGAFSGMTRVRYLGNWLFAKLLGWLVGQRVTDSASGLRIFTRAALPQLLPLPDGLNLTPVMSARAHHEGLRIIEVPIPYDIRQGRSKLSVIRDGLRFSSSILAVSRLYNPLKFFGLLGAVFFLAAELLAINPIFYYLHAHRVESTEMYRLFTIMVLLVTSVNLVTFGAFCNQVLAMLYPHRPPQSGFFARVLLRRGVIQSAGWVGGGVMLLAVLLNHETLRQYLLTGRIYVHWSYVLTGATLFLIGAQLVMGHFFIQVLRELRGAIGLREEPTAKQASAAHLEDQVEHWRHVGYRAADDPVTVAFAKPKLEWITRHIDLTGMTVLDVGCGNGAFTIHLATWASQTVGLDYSAEMLTQHPCRPLVRGVAEALPFPDGAFDIVFCANLLHHVYTPVVVVREMARVARRAVVIVEPNALNPIMFGFALLVKAERGGLRSTPRNVKAWLQAAGLHCRAVKAMGMISQNNTPGALVPILRAFDREFVFGEYLVAIGEKLVPQSSHGSRPKATAGTSPLMTSEQRG